MIIYVITKLCLKPVTTLIGQSIRVALNGLVLSMLLRLVLADRYLVMIVFSPV